MLGADGSSVYEPRMGRALIPPCCTNYDLPALLASVEQGTGTSVFFSLKIQNGSTKWTLLEFLFLPFSCAYAPCRGFLSLSCLFCRASPLDVDAVLAVLQEVGTEHILLFPEVGLCQGRGFCLAINNLRCSTLARPVPNTLPSQQTHSKLSALHSP